MSFSFETLSEPLFSALEEMGIKTPTEIQEKAIPLLLEEDTDFMGQAQTGTGKTAAFCLPLLEKIDYREPQIQAFILSPTRELAHQINEEIKKFARHLPLRTAVVYGGVGYKEQIQQIRSAQIVIATPGRAIDLMKRNKLDLSDSRILIIDEADEMLKMGFIEDVEFIMESISPSANTWMFSATMPAPIVRLMKDKLNAPKVVSIKNVQMNKGQITQSYCCLPKKQFTRALRAILLTEKDFFGIVFCETREETKFLSEKLTLSGQSAVTLHGDLNQKQRDHAIAQFRQRRANILVCTDVAARGLDISEVTHVINMGLPRKIDSYVHRIGRTGRAGNSGKAISFITPGETSSLRMLERSMGFKLNKFKSPCASESKRNKIQLEIEKMNGLKQAVIEKGKGFAVDETYHEFAHFLEGMNKDEVSKLLFSYLFNSELKSIDESLHVFSQPIELTPPPSSNRFRGRRAERNSRSEGNRRPPPERNSRNRRGGRPRRSHQL